MKNTRELIAVVLISFSLLGCDNAVQKAVRDKLTDPSSAKFGKVTYIGVKKDNACVTVNAKNRLGGYTGDLQAVAHIYTDSLGGETWLSVGPYNISHRECIEKVEENIEKRTSK